MFTAGNKRRLRTGALVALAGATAATSLIAVNAIATAQSPDAAASIDPASVILGAGAADAIDGEYIIAFEERADQLGEIGALTGELASEIGSALGIDIDVEAAFDTINAVVAEMTEEDAVTLAMDDAVAYVEQNRLVGVADVQTEPPSWGLDRIDQTALPLDDVYEYHADGAGTTSYILDTGIRLTHQEFAGRIAPGFDAFTPGGDADDCHGHGTHVAGTVGGTSYGVAKQTTLVPVRVLDCDGFGPYSDIIAGIEWVAANAEGPSVANMSLGGPVSQSVNDAVAAAVAAGVTFVVSSGNEGEDACDFSPAAESTAITVGAVDYNDGAAIWSNSGTCVDLFAPGVSITSAGYRADDAHTMMSGTSMASPHVAGAAALYLSANHEATPEDVTRAILDNAVPGVVDNPGGSPNLMLYTGFIGG